MGRMQMEFVLFVVLLLMPLSNAERLLTILTVSDSKMQVLTLAFYPSTWLAAFVFWLIPPDNHLIAHTYS